MHDHGRPWGLNGPEFLVIYAVALAAVCCVVAVVRKRVCNRELRSGDNVNLSIYERAYLTGGAARVADTALAGLVEARAVRVDRNRRITATGPKGEDGFQALVLEHIGNGTKVPALRRRFRDSGRCGPIADGLCERRLLVPAEGRRAVRAVLGLYPLLMVIGGVRAITGAAQHFPIGLLVWEVIISVFAWRVAAGSCEEPLVTKAGRAARSRGPLTPTSRPEHRRARTTPRAAEAARPETPPEDAASRVAGGGFRSYPDTQLARLLEPPKRSSGGGGAVGGAGGGCGGGGGGCGGGGA